MAQIKEVAFKAAKDKQTKVPKGETSQYLQRENLSTTNETDLSHYFL